MDQQATSHINAPALPAVRPLSTGEVLDRTFVLYRRNFWLFAGIGCLPAAVLTVTSMVRLVYLAVTHRTDTFVPGSSSTVVADAMGTMALLQIYLLPAMALFLVAYGLSHAASIIAVTRASQGVPPTAMESYRQVRQRWLRWVGIALRQFWAFLWPLTPPLLIGTIMVAFAGKTRSNADYASAALVGLAMLLIIPGGFVWGAINFLRAALAMPAGVTEDLGVNAALRRSRVLVAGRKGRIFLALLLVYALQMVAAGIQVPMVFLAVKARGAEHVLLQAIQLFVQFVVTTLIAPVASIALCLFYVDERVRREGYDIELLMQRSFSPLPEIAAAGEMYPPHQPVL